MKKVVIFLFFILFIVFVWLFVRTHSSTFAQKTLPLISPTQVVQPTKSVTFGTPTRFQIPKLGIDTAIEKVGMDKKGNMDVPKNADNVAWYKLGYKIGSPGSAVIAAHYDKPDGSPAVFYYLTNLRTGDKIIISDDQGNNLTYEVIDEKAYPYDAFPLQEVFNTSDMPRLNLITCDGTWDRSKKTYDKRLVVYSKLLNS